jgi:outer membrane lipoprotein
MSRLPVNDSLVLGLKVSVAKEGGFMSRLAFLMLLSFVAAGCTTVPKSLAVGRFVEVTPAAAQTDGFVGQRVRWGGSIATAEPGKRETCFEVVSRPLDSSARPKETDRTEGRFIACAPGFYDPAVYAQGREVTITGVLQKAVVRKLGEYDYRFPRVGDDAVYLWPKLEVYERWPPYYYGPYWYGPWPGRYWYPYWW